MLASKTFKIRDRFIAPQIDGIIGFEFFPANFKIKTLMDDMNNETCKFISDGSESRNFFDFPTQVSWLMFNMLLSG